MNICTKCKQPIVVPEDKDFIICGYGEVIYIIHETHDRETEE